MILILGYITPNVDEVPEILYLGNDRVTALQIAEDSKYPRVCRIDNPETISRPIKHWTEEAATAFAKLQAAMPAPIDSALEIARAEALELFQKDLDDVTGQRDQLEEQLAALQKQLKKR